MFIVFLHTGEKNWIPSDQRKKEKKDGFLQIVPCSLDKPWFPLPQTPAIIRYTQNINLCNVLLSGGLFCTFLSVWFIPGSELTAVSAEMNRWNRWNIEPSVCIILRLFKASCRKMRQQCRICVVLAKINKKDRRFFFDTATWGCQSWTFMLRAQMSRLKILFTFMVLLFLFGSIYSLYVVSCCGACLYRKDNLWMGLTN